MAEKKAKFSREYRVFLELLRAERKAAGLTQATLAKKLKMKQDVVSKCERGERRVDIIEARRFCSAFGVEFGTFVSKLDAAIEQAAASRKSATRD